MPKHLVSAISLTLWVYKNPLFGYQLSVVSCQHISYQSIWFAQLQFNT
jgi:hypothetical protein